MTTPSLPGGNVPGSAPDPRSVERSQGTSSPALLPLPANTEERMLRWSSIDPATGCRLWTGCTDRKGYGRIAITRERANPRTIGAHRVAYELWKGPIPSGLTVDHLCFTPGCINPSHLRLLTYAENSANQRSRFNTHCAKGHERTPANTSWERKSKTDGRLRRRCSVCIRERWERWSKARAELQVAV